MSDEPITSQRHGAGEAAPDAAGRRPRGIDRRRFLNSAWKVLGVALIAEARLDQLRHPEPGSRRLRVAVSSTPGR